MGKYQEQGSKGERLVVTLLKFHLGAENVERMGYYDAFDVKACGKRLEIKTCKPAMHKGGPAWVANLHRHGKMKAQPDFYIIRLEDIPGFKNSLHLLLPGQQTNKTLRFSLRSLLNGDFKYALAFKEFVKDGNESRKKAATSA